MQSMGVADNTLHRSSQEEAGRTTRVVDSENTFDETEVEDRGRLGVHAETAARERMLTSIFMSVSLVIAVVFGGYLNGKGLVGVLTLFFLQFSCLGAVCSLTISSEEGIGGEWAKGINVIPDIFAAVGGMIAALPLVVPFFENCFDWFYAIYSTPAHAACSFLDPTMQAGTVANIAVRGDMNVAYPASAMAYFLGDFVAFSLPIGLLIVADAESQRYLMLGVIPGVFCIPVALFITYLFLYIQEPMVNSKIEANPVLDFHLKIDLVASTLAVTTPCWIVAALMAVCLKLSPALLTTLFVGFGTGLNYFLRTALMLSILQHIGGLIWLFKDIPLLQMQPLIKDSTNEQYFVYTQTTGLEVAASIGIALSGTLPFMHLLREKYLSTVTSVGRAVAFKDPQGFGILGLAGSLSSMMVLFNMMPRISPKECVAAVAFSIPAAYLIGGHLAFSSIYQPPLCAPLLTGKVIGGFVAMWVARLTTCRLVEDEHENHGEETIERRITEARKSRVPGSGPMFLVGGDAQERRRVSTQEGRRMLPEGEDDGGLRERKMAHRDVVLLGEYCEHRESIGGQHCAPRVINLRNTLAQQQQVTRDLVQNIQDHIQAHIESNLEGEKGAATCGDLKRIEDHLKAPLL